MKASEVLMHLKGELFLSPREELFIRTLTERLRIPEEVVAEGIKRCLQSLPPERRRRFPLFRCFSAVKEVYKLYKEREAKKQALPWRETFYEKLEAVKDLVEFSFEEPRSEKEAEEVLRLLERKLMGELWRKLSPQEKRKIAKKYAEFREEEELFKELVKEELRRLYRLPVLSLYSS